MNREPREDLTQAVDILARGDTLTADEAQFVMAVIDDVLRDEYAEIDWDDAWDSIDHLKSSDSILIPYLCRMTCSAGNGTRRDRYTRKWAVRAISKIGGDISSAVPYLLDIYNGSDIELRKEAAKTLRKCGYKHLIKHNWFNWFG